MWHTEEPQSTALNSRALLLEISRYPLKINNMFLYTIFKIHLTPFSTPDELHWESLLHWCPWATDRKPQCLHSFYQVEPTEKKKSNIYLIFHIDWCHILKTIQNNEKHLLTRKSFGSLLLSFSEPWIFKKRSVWSFRKSSLHNSFTNLYRI